MGKSLSTCMQCHAVNRFDFQKAMEQRPRCGQCQGALRFENGVSNVDLHDLNAIINAAPVPVILDLWAPWCGPCVGFAPVFLKVAKQLGSSYIFLKINTEQYPDAGNILGVRGIPTLIMFSGGDEIKRQSGAMPEPMFRQWLQ